jgi:LPXTG-motif cell wall-anchored protein
VTLRRLLAGTAAIIATLFVLAGPAQAQGSYPVVRGDATVSATTVTVGGTVTVSGGGFSSDCPVVLTVRVGNTPPYITQALTPNGSGNVSADVTLTRTGRNVIELTGCQDDGATRVLSARVIVRGAGAGSGLPSTGGDLTSLYAGIGLLAAGGLLVMVTRQRRKVLV